MSFKLENLMRVQCLGAIVSLAGRRWGGEGGDMKVASEGRPERQASPGAGWGHPALTCFRSPLGSSQVKPLLPPFIPNLFFEVWLHFLILTSFFFFFFCHLCQGFYNAISFYFKNGGFQASSHL